LLDKYFFYYFLRDDEVRRFYGEKAKQFGAVPIHPNQKLRKVIVLINSEAKRQHAARIFNKNGLPLLNLAGLDINILNVRELLIFDLNVTCRKV